MSHIIEVAHGILAALACGTAFCLAGLVLTPERWHERLDGPSLLFLGAAAYAVVCFTAVTAWHTPLTGITAVFVAGVATLVVLRFARVRAATPHIARRGAIAGALVFAGSYAAAYAIALPPADGLFLTPAAGHAELVTHARYARHLLLWGLPDLQAAAFDFSRAPAIPTLLAGFSTFYGDDPLRAVLPLQFAAVGLIGAAAFAIGRSLFRLATIPALTIAGVAVTSAYVSAIAGPRRIETTMAVPIALYLFWAAARIRLDDAAGIVALRFGCGYALLLLTEAALLPVVLGVQAVFVGVQIFRARQISRAVIAAAGAAAVVLLALQGQVRWSLVNAGIGDALASFWIAFAILAMAVFACLACDKDWQKRLSLAPSDQRLVGALAVYVAIALVLANAAAHASVQRRAPARIPASWQNIEGLKDRSPRALTLKLTRDPGGLLAPVTHYFLPRMALEIVPPGSRVPDYGAASRETPLLIQSFGCEGVGHGDTAAIPGVGCTLFAPPSVALETAYPFNRTFLAVAFDNMSDREPGGRWSTGRTLRLALRGDPERVPVNRDLYVNVFVSAFLPAVTSPQRLALTWGSGRHGAGVLGAPGWISIPIGAGDWSDNRLRVLRIAIDFPDGGSMLFQDLTISEIARGNVVR